MNKLLLNCLLFGIFISVLGAQTPRNTSSITPSRKSTTTKSIKKSTTINWLTLEEAQKLNEKEQRKFIIDIYTDWCGWCKKMDATTFTHPEIVEVINTHFYAIKLNAEQKEDIIFNGKTYKNKAEGTRPTHELALELLKNRTSYPTTVFLDEQLELIQPIPGFLDAEKIAPILAYFQTNSYKNVPWEKFEREFVQRKERK